MHSERRHFAPSLLSAFAEGYDIFVIFTFFDLFFCHVFFVCFDFLGFCGFYVIGSFCFFIFLILGIFGFLRFLNRDFHGMEWNEERNNMPDVVRSCEMKATSCKTVWTCQRD